MFVYPIYNHNWRNISTIYIYNKTSTKRNILIIKKIHREVRRAKDLSAPRYIQSSVSGIVFYLWAQSVFVALRGGGGAGGHQDEC
jgi:hypothetical protein